MRDKLFSLLGIESGEESMVSMLLTQSVFLGIFFGAFDISAHSLFLSIFDEKMMARGYVVSGLAGILLTTLYTWLQTRMQFKNFAILNLIAVTTLTFLLWGALIFSPSKWIVFLVFIMLGPLNILAMLGFWGTTGRLFSLRQGKRLFGLVDVGLIIGVIVSCYTIPVLLTLNFESHNILLVSVSAVLIATVIQIMIGSRFKFSSGGGEQKSDRNKEKRSVLNVFRQDPYTRTMAIFIALSVVTAFFVQYSFMAVTREQYPSEEDMARFLGIFTGSMMIFTLLVKLLVFSYLIRNYGLKTCLAISPILVAVFTAIAIAIGILMGYTPEAQSGFLIFFLLLALSRLFSKALKDSIESPSFKVIYQTIDEKIRYEIQSGMDGTVNEIAALSSGLILAGLGILSFITLIHFSFVLFFIIIIWIFVAVRLYTEYRKSIRKALEADSTGDSNEREVSDLKGFKNRFSAQRAFRGDYFSLVTGDYAAVEKTTNEWYFKSIIDFSASKMDFNLISVLRKISSDTRLSENIRRESGETAAGIEEKLATGTSHDEKTLFAHKILSGSRTPQATEILRLLRDNSYESKRQAIFMIGKFKIADLLPEVCECLNIQELETDAFVVLSSFGSEAANELIRFYLVSSGNTNTSKTLLRLLGKSGNPVSDGFLFSRLWSNSRQLKEVALNCLIERGFSPSNEERDRLHQYISDIVGVMTWNLSAKISLVRNNDTVILEALKREIYRWNRFLFNILSITYDSGSITKIRQNLESDTVESVNYALEMIDIVIDDSIKPKLIALLDVLPDEEKVKGLYHFFPGEIPSYSKVIEDIINRDYNLISIWTKACTLWSLKEIEGDDLAESIVALLFSPEILIQEEAARLIARSSRELYRAASQRIPEGTKLRLDKIVDGVFDDNELLFNKIKLVSSEIGGIPEEELISLASAMAYQSYSETVGTQFGEGCLIWSVSEGHLKNNAIAAYNENIAQLIEKRFAEKDKMLYILPLSAVEEYIYQFPERSADIMKFIDRNEG